MPRFRLEYVLHLLFGVPYLFLALIPQPSQVPCSSGQLAYEAGNGVETAIHCVGRCVLLRVSGPQSVVES
jgi:hypothetical protein